MDYLDTKYFSYANPDDSFSKKALIRTIEYFSGQPRLYKLYREYQTNAENWDDFWDGCIDKLELQVNFNEEKIINEIKTKINVNTNMPFSKPITNINSHF